MHARAVLVSVAVAIFIAAPAASGTTSADLSGVAGSSELRPQIIKVDEGRTNLVDVSRQHLPVPGQAAGIGPGSHLIIRMDDEPGVVFGCTANFVWSGAGVVRAAGHALGAVYSIPDLTGVRAHVWSSCDLSIIPYARTRTRNPERNMNTN